MNRVHIAPVTNHDDLHAVARLFEAYAASLPVDLGYQGFAAELAGLPGNYAPPRGALLLARGTDGIPLGSIGVRSLTPEEVGELKRLYVVPAARGSGLGRALAEAAIEAARGLGHCELRLDTLPSMTAAIAMYEQMGFVRMPPYYGPTPPGTVFMSLTL